MALHSEGIATQTDYQANEPNESLAFNDGSTPTSPPQNSHTNPSNTGTSSSLVRVGPSNQRNKPRRVSAPFSKVAKPNSEPTDGKPRKRIPRNTALAQLVRGNREWKLSPVRVKKFYERKEKQKQKQLKQKKRKHCYAPLVHSRLRHTLVAVYVRPSPP